MSTYKFFFSFLFMSLMLITACELKKDRLTNAELKVLLKLTLNDKDLQRRMGVLQENHVKNWVLVENKTVADTFYVENRNYRFSIKTDSLRNDSTIFYSIIYKEKNTILIGLKYYPGSFNMITGDFEFRYKEEKWSLITKNTGIACGKFKYMNY